MILKKLRGGNPEPPKGDSKVARYGQTKERSKYSYAKQYVEAVLKTQSVPMSTSELRRLVKTAMKDGGCTIEQIKDVIYDFLNKLHWMSGKGMIKRVGAGNRSQYYWSMPNIFVPLDWEASDADPGEYDEEEGDDPDYPRSKEEQEEDEDTSDEKEEFGWKAEMTRLRELVVETARTVSDLRSTVDKLDKARRVELVIIENGKETKIKEKVHSAFAETLFQIKCGYFPLLVGPSGCGKTELAKQMAKHLKKRFGMQSFSGGVTEAKLYGRSTPNITTGKQEYHMPQFVDFYGSKEGGLYLLDEVDGGDPNVLLSLNGPLSNRIMTVDRKVNPTIEMSDKFTCIAAANTWGAGADRQYVGRNQLDLAFIKRFVLVEMDYDEELEISLCPGKDDFIERMHRYRVNMRRNRVERVLDTRFIIRGYNWYKHGKDDEYVDKQLFLGWRDDEIRKAKGI